MCVAPITRSARPGISQITIRSVWRRADRSRIALIEVRRGRLATLKAVYDAIANCVEGAIDAHYDFEEDDIVVEFEGDRFPFRSLSDGQRNMAATAADMAMRCSQLNPQLKDRARTETPGVVLIDEIDQIGRAHV